MPSPPAAAAAAGFRLLVERWALQMADAAAVAEAPPPWTRRERCVCGVHTAGACVL
jgi:hypothetical protein